MSIDKKATAIYIRVSTETQKEEGYSIEAQTEKLQAYCVAKGYSRRELYIDGGYTGSNINRPELQRLVADIKHERIERVLVYKLDRLSRSQKDTLYLIEDTFNPHHVDFVSLSESLDTSSPLGRLMIGILSAFAQLERENIKERTKMGSLQRVKRGHWKGGVVAFGFDYDKEKGILVPNEDSEKVKQMYSLYLDGYSFKKIAKMLGLRHENSVRDCLMRKTNIGVYEYSGVVYESKNESIISQEIYNKTMDMMRERSYKPSTAGEHLLTGLIFCGKCGARFKYKYNNTTGYSCLTCYSVTKEKSYMIKDPSCKNKNVSIKNVERAVIDDLFSISIKQSDNKMQGEVKSSVIDILNKQYTDTNNQLKRLYLLYASEENDALLDIIEQIKKELSRLQSQISAESEKHMVSSPAADYTKQLETIKETWQYMTTKEKKNILHAIVNKVLINDGNIEIVYKFNRS